MAVGASVARGITPYGQYVLQDIFVATPHPHLYGTMLGIGYPPPWGLVTGLAYLFSSAAAPDNLYAYVFALKMPILLAEIATAILVYNIFKVKLDEKVASKAFLLFLFCPFIIAVGTVWGMFDVLALFFTLLSAYGLYSNWKLSSLCLSVASVLKVFPFILAPLYSVLLYKSSRSLKTAFSFLVFTVALSVFFTATPMVAFGWPMSNLYNALIYHTTTTNPSYYSQTSFPYGAASIFNSFTLLNDLTDGTIQLPWLFSYIWIPACIAVYLFLLCLRMRGKRENNLSSNFAFTVQWSLLLLLVFFTTRVWVSEQNVIFLFAFLALSIFLQNPQDFGTIQILWLLLFSFVMVHVPVIAFFWLPYPWALDVASSFADGPLGWTRLLLMTLLTFSWFGLSWNYVARKLRWQ